ncbi:MAG: 50S ribosomal protein L37ae [Candidatus Micrarchaeota archaeon]
MGSHYGVKTRKREREVIEHQNKLYLCSQCGKHKVMRKGYALWRCTSCGSQFAGGAYSLETPVGVTARKALSSLKPKR